MLLVAVCVLASLPFVEMGVNDDWSYAYTAKKLAETGHLTYNGWAAFPLGAQAYWGALWIKTCGFSFTLLRLSMLPLAMGCACVVYALLRLAGVKPNLSLLGTLSFVLSPLFLPCAASFMSDVSSLFFYLLALYGYCRAASVALPPVVRQAEGSAPAMPVSVHDASLSHILRWLLAATFAGLVGTTIRQSVWLVPLLCLPCLAWLWRGERRLAPTAGALWAASALFGALYLRWFKAQPYSLPESIKGNLIFVAHNPARVAQTGALLSLMLALALLPVLAGSLLSWRILRTLKAGAWILIVAFSGMGMLWCARSREYAPWQPSILTVHGIYGADMVLGLPPRVLSAGVCVLLSLLAFALTATVVALLLQRVTPDIADAVSRSVAEDADANPPAAASAGGVTLRLCLLTSAVYLPLACTRLTVFDRYLLPIMPVAMIVVLLGAQRRQGDRAGQVGWLLLTVFAVYGVAGLHDYFAMNRARVQAVALLTQAGVPSEQIMAGFDYDGWTQLERAGHVNNAAVVTPAGAYRKRPDALPPINCPSWLYDVLSAVNMRYAVVTAPQPALANTRYAPTAYSAWLPPFDRRIYIQQRSSRDIEN